MNRHPVIDGSIGHHHDRARCDNGSLAGSNVSRRAILEFFGLSQVEDPSAFLFDRTREGLKIFQWVKLRLPRKAQGRTRVKVQRSARHQLDLREARPVRGV